MSAESNPAMAATGISLKVLSLHHVVRWYDEVNGFAVEDGLEESTAK